jgi:drug/metabolite transporter (DMT)-like permease
MADRKSQLDGLAVVALVLCCFLWGLNQVAAKAVLPEIPALWQAAARSLGGALLVWLWSALRGIPLWGRDGTTKGGLLAGLLFAAEFACIFIGLQYTTASRMAVFIYLSPFVVALGMPWISRAERLAWPQMAGLALAFAGVAWAFAEGFSRPSAGERQWIGDTLGVGAAVLWGATTLAIRGSRLTSASPEKTLLYQLGIAGVVLGAAAALGGVPLPRSLSALAWASLGFQVVVVSFFSFLLWFWLMRHYPATRLSSFTLLTPMFGLGLGALLLDEPISVRLGLALVGVSAGIWLVNRPARHAHTAGGARDAPSP